MKTFLAICLGTTDDAKFKAWKEMPEEEKKKIEKEGMESWAKWGEDHKASIVDMGTPIGKTKRVDNGGVSDTKNAISGYTIVRAETHEEAAKMFEKHPHFAIFPGEAVEVMECLPMPTMN